jgi:hypothetical protein
MIADILRLFPAVIAPAIVDRLRRRWPSLDGLLVWPVVVAVAVLLSALALFAGGAPATLATIAQAAREGLALGAAAIGLHYLAKGKAATEPGQVTVAGPLGSKVTVEATLGEPGAPPAPPPAPPQAWGPPPSKG